MVWIERARDAILGCDSGVVRDEEIEVVTVLGVAGHVVEVTLPDTSG